jgi:hypothetical protein
MMQRIYVTFNIFLPVLMTSLSSQMMWSNMQIFDVCVGITDCFTEHIDMLTYQL